MRQGTQAVARLCEGVWVLSPKERTFRDFSRQVTWSEAETTTLAAAMKRLEDGFRAVGRPVGSSCTILGENLIVT